MNRQNEAKEYEAKKNNEAWLRGPIEGVSPLLTPTLHSFQQAREDLALHTAGLTAGQIWHRPFGLGSVGFHLRHIAGSVDRLATYLEDKQLSEGQLAALARESSPGADLEELMASLKASFLNAGQIIRSIDDSTLAESRGVGRKRLPTTVIGLLVHISEHTQRHVGQAIAAAKLARATAC